MKVTNKPKTCSSTSKYLTWINSVPHATKKISRTPKVFSQAASSSVTNLRKMIMRMIKHKSSIKILKTEKRGKEMNNQINM